MNRLRIAVLASGRGSNLQAIIDAIESGELNAEIVIVISDKKNAYALKRAKRHGINRLFISPKDKKREEYDKEIVNQLHKYNVELVCLAGFMRILSPYFVKEFKNRIMNIHPTLLPSFPGLHGQKQALDYGVKISGCTVHFVDEGCDTGPIILQKAVEVLDTDTEESLSSRILECEHKLYPQAISLFASGRLKILGRKVIIL
ncbi:MAG: phosphoribosylglycinamide formyltransferase [bacterium]|nr:phosphoribosylglycinamide formyltransferase [bacterium]